MSCLAHDKRYRSAFHNIINELRNENRTPVAVLHTIPRRCCTCKDESHATIQSITTMLHEEHSLVPFEKLIERIIEEKHPDSKLILSINRFRTLIKENRNPLPIMSVQTPEPVNASVASRNKTVKNGYTSSSDSDDDVTPMDTSKRNVRCKTKQSQKPGKKINYGTFVFLPYNMKGKSSRNKSDSLLEVAKKLQLSRFIGRTGHVAALEEQYKVRINIVTPETSKQVTEALEKAKQGLENLTIRNKEKSMEIAEKEKGEWVLVRSKKPQNQTNNDDIEHLLDDLTNRWERCLQIEKRTFDDESDQSPIPGWKKKTVRE